MHNKFGILPVFFLVVGCRGDSEPTDTGTSTTQTTTVTTTSETSATTATGLTETGQTGTTSTTSTGFDWANSLVINEFMANNNGGFEAADGSYPDWVELYNLTDQTLDLDGLTMTDDLDERDKHVLSGLTIEPYGFLLLMADDNVDAGNDHLGFALNDDGESIGLYGPDSSVINQLKFGAQGSNLTAARNPDGSANWEYTYGGTPGYSNVPLILVEEVLLSEGSDFKYLDNDAAEPSGWPDSVDASSWSSGPGPLGYGDSHIVTEIEYGGDSNNKAITSYYRGQFTWDADVDAVELWLGLLSDDGALVYLNGNEVIRSLLDSGDIDEETLASSETSDETGYAGWEIDPKWLVSGVNVITAEVHQATPSSSDSGFDMTVKVKVEK
jgi:hypothetical protein